ncbi:MAG: dTMP kinase [Cardiobacteriaceae bacterium]|nr:dTMP kinase [Cardiobacteriaceae bacterium]
MPTRGLFITLDGTEATGKTTQIQKLQAWCAEHHQPVYLTREPGGTEVGERIRELFLHQSALHAETELLLMLAARVEHVRQVILPKLEAGIWVISDRYHDATYAYQGYGRGLDLGIIHQWEQWLQLPSPDLALILMSDEAISRARLEKRSLQQAKDRIEQESANFHARVREGYLARSQQERHVLINANLPPDAVFHQILNTLQPLLRQSAL